MTADERRTATLLIKTVKLLAKEGRKPSTDEIAMLAGKCGFDVSTREGAQGMLTTAL